MTMKFPQSDWWSGLQDLLNADEQWLDAAKHFEARVEYRYPQGAGYIEIRGGKVVIATDAPSAMGADIVVSAPDAGWDDLFAGKTDWFHGMTPVLGKFSMEGNAVLAMRNVRCLALALNAMKRVGHPRSSGRPYSPAPVKSGKPTIGKYAEIDGLRVYYEEAGEGRPLVCFHAASQDSLMWRHVLDGLSDRYRVIAVDAPGHCKSQEPATGPFTSLTSHAEFNEKLMDKLSLEKPAIVGCSMGGNLVLELAARRPDFYSAVISAEGADYTPTVSQFVLDMLLLNGPQIIQCWAESLIGDRTPPDRARDVVWQIRRTCPEVMCGDLTGYANFDRRDMVGKITVPVLLIRGDADWLVYQEQVEATRDRIPGAKMVVLDGTGHYPMTENPQEFNDSVRSFLETSGF
jgi:pimeloyl-ACP methyl ester carboxylesterase/putative sterol carrier protein